MLDVHNEPRACASMREPRRHQTPRRLVLPTVEGKRWVNEARISAEMLEIVTACNACVPTKYSRVDIRRNFVDGLTSSYPPLAVFVREVHALCPKTWPVVMHLMDKASVEGELPITLQTVYRMLAGAAYLVLSTEDDEVTILLARMMYVSLRELVGWGCAVEALARSDVGADGWDESIGLAQLGALRTELRRCSRRLHMDYARRVGGGDATVGDVMTLQLATRRDSDSDSDTEAASMPATSTTPSTAMSMSMSMSRGSLSSALADTPCVTTTSVVSPADILFGTPVSTRRTVSSF